MGRFDRISSRKTNCTDKDWYEGAACGDERHLRRLFLTLENACQFLNNIECYMIQNNV